MKCSLGISNFLEKISSLSHSIVFPYFFALITEEGFLISPCCSLKLCIQMSISFLFSFAFCFSFFSQLFVRPPQPFCLFAFLFLGDDLDLCFLYNVLDLQNIKRPLQWWHPNLKCQRYGFSSSHVWMWELDQKESWALRNWCFLIVVLEKTWESLGVQGDQTSQS